jgi:hypothetical protein
MSKIKWYLLIGTSTLALVSVGVALAVEFKPSKEPYNGFLTHLGSFFSWSSEVMKLVSTINGQQVDITCSEAKTVGMYQVTTIETGNIEAKGCWLIELTANGRLNSNCTIGVPLKFEYEGSLVSSAVVKFGGRPPGETWGKVEVSTCGTLNGTYKLTGNKACSIENGSLELPFHEFKCPPAPTLKLENESTHVSEVASLTYAEVVRLNSGALWKIE